MTKINNHPTSTTATVPQSKTIKYRLAIKQPEEWKIRSIAQYKQKQRLKQLKQQQFEQQQSLAIETGVDGKKKSSKSSSSSSGNPSSTVTATKDDNGLKDIDIKNAYESHVRELANCHFTSTVAKARITALHSVRISLLWLLKKTSLHERSLIQDHLQALSSTNQ